MVRDSNGILNSSRVGGARWVARRFRSAGARVAMALINAGVPDTAFV